VPEQKYTVPQFHRSILWQLMKSLWVGKNYFQNGKVDQLKKCGKNAKNAVRV
jgi:hypothetical protein